MCLKCSECGGEVRKVNNKTIMCTQCGRKRVIEEKVETVDMSETAGLSVIME